MSACYVHEDEIHYLERVAKKVPLWLLLYQVASVMDGDPSDTTTVALQRLYEILTVGIAFLTTIVIGRLRWEEVKSVRPELKYVKDFYVDPNDYSFYGNELGVVRFKGLSRIPNQFRRIGRGWAQFLTKTGLT